MHLKIMVEPVDRESATRTRQFFVDFFEKHEPQSQVWMFPGDDGWLRCDVVTLDYGARGRTVWMARLLADLGHNNDNPQWFRAVQIIDMEQSPNVLIGEIAVTDTLNDFFRSF